MITARHYQLDTRSTPWDIAHLFEHLIIRMSRDHLHENGYSRDFLGWFSGATFDECLFLDASFYQAEAAQVFDNFMQNIPVPTSKQLENSIKTVEAEEKSHFQISKEQLSHEMAKLARRPWNESYSQTDTAEADKNITLRSGTKDFRDVSIIVMSESLSLEEKKLLMRLRTIIIDVINNKLLYDYAAYSRGDSPLYIRDNIGKFLSVYTVTRAPGRLTGLAAELTSYINDYPIRDHERELRIHFDTFADEALWQEMVVEYYRYGGVITTVEEIGSLASLDNVENIFKKIKIGAKTASNHEKSLLY